VDGAGHETTVSLDPLPANDGAPVINTAFINSTTAAGSYTVESASNCEVEVACNYPLQSGDGISNARFENRSTPGFEAVPAVVFEAFCVADCGLPIFDFDPTTVAGAIGDEIWLVAEDGHPEWQVAEALIWTLPQIPGAPTVGLGAGDLVFYGDAYHLIVPAGTITDSDGPLTLELVAWRQISGEWIQVATASRSFSSGDAFDMEIAGGAEGDLVVVTVADATPLETTQRVGSLPAPTPIVAYFESERIFVGEDDVDVELHIILSSTPTTAVSVHYRTIAGSAESDVDFEHTDEVVFFPGISEATVSVQVYPDADPDGTETFEVELYNPVGVDLSPWSWRPSTAEVIILDADSEVPTVAYSVGVDTANMLEGTITVNIVNGTATFAEPLPDGPDRGDRVELQSHDAVYLAGCADDMHCTVTDPLGLPPADVSDDATAIVPAFDSLAAAVAGAGDADHLGSSDLLAIDRSLELLCYGGAPDNAPVDIWGWVTTPWHRIRIVVPTAGGQRGTNQRHAGRWSDEAYRLDVVGADGCINSEVGYLTLEGLQLNCENSYGDVYGIQLDDIEGDVEIAETLVHLGPSS
jgi:hypothetical protein